MRSYLESYNVLDATAEIYIQDPLRRTIGELAAVAMCSGSGSKDGAKDQGGVREREKQTYTVLHCAGWCALKT